MVIDLGGREIPWYAGAPIGARNYTQQERPAVLSAQDIQNYIEYERNLDAKMREGNGWFNDIVGNLNPIKIAAMVAASTAGMPYLIPAIAGADTALQGGNIEDVLKSAAISAATQAVGGQIPGAEGFSDVSETGLATLAGEGVAADVGATLLNDIGTSNLLSETGSEIGAYTTPVDNPVYGDFYDAKPLTDPYTGQPFGSIQDPLVDNYMDGFTSTSETGLATLPEEGMQPDLPGTTILGDLGLAGAVETPIPSSSISISQALRGLNLAKGLLGGGQESAAAPATQFRGARLPKGEVDYSGILSLLQMRSPQRRSLLG